MNSSFTNSTDSIWEKEWEKWKISDEIQNEFKEIFMQVDQDHDGFISGEQAKLFFSSSGLSKEVLAKIWSLSDRNRDLKLDLKEYIIAMFLIRMKQAGAVIPNSLPKNLVSSVYPDQTGSPSKTPQSSTEKLPPFLSNSISTQDFSNESISSYKSVPTSPNSSVSDNYKSIPELLENQDISALKLKEQIDNLCNQEDDVDQIDSTPPPYPGPRPIELNPYGEMPSPILPKTETKSVNKLPQSSNPYGQIIQTKTAADQVEILEKKLSEQLKGKDTDEYKPFKSSELNKKSDSPIPPISEGSNQDTGINVGIWKEFETKEGRKYYHNKELNITTWKAPQEFIPFNKRTTRTNSDFTSTVEPQTESTASIMKDPSKVEFFKKFLEAEGNNRDMLFLMDVENWSKSVKSLPPNQNLSNNLIQNAQVLFAKYIIKEAPFKIETQNKIKREIKHHFKEFNKKNIPIPRSIFDDAHEDVMKRLNSEQFPRFVKSMFYLTMYNAILNRNSYELPEEIWKEFRIAAEGGVETGWEYVTETKGVLIHKRKYTGWNGTCIRGSGIIGVSPDDMRVIANNFQVRHNWDNLQDPKILERFDKKTIILSWVYPPPKLFGMMSSHEFVMLRTERIDSDGAILLLSRSVVHPDVPEKKNPVRSELDIGGFLIKPCGTHSSVVIYVSQTELIGLPKILEEAAVSRRALTIHNIRRFVDKELKESQKKGRQPIWKTASSEYM